MLSEQELDHVIDLAHIEINKEEKEVYLKQLGKIFDYMAVLNNLDLSKFSTTVHTDIKETPLREDLVKKYNDLNLPENAPEMENNCFAVPKILNE